MDNLSSQKNKAWWQKLGLGEENYQAELEALVGKLQDAVLFIDARGRVVRAWGGGVKIMFGTTELVDELADKCLEKLGGGLIDWHKESVREVNLTSGQVARIQVFSMGSGVMAVAIKDVSYEMALKGKAEEEAQRYQEIVESAGDLIQSVDDQGNFLYVNPAWRRALGYEEADIAKLNLWEIIAPESQTDCKAVFGRLLSGNMAMEIKATFLAKGGKRVYLEGSASSKVRDGKLVSTRGVFHDMTAKMAYQEQQNKQNQLLSDTKRAMLNILEDVEAERTKTRAIIESISQGVLVVNSQLEIEMANLSISELLGYTVKELLGRPYFSVFDIYGDDGLPIPPQNRPLSRAISTGQSTTAIFKFNRKDGRKIELGVAVSPVKIGERVIGAVSVYRDVTHEKEVDRMKTEFISLASHQLRTPLSAIKWFSEMLLDGDAGALNEKQTEMMGSLAKSCERMIELVNSLLDISRIEQGRIVIDPKPTDLAGLAQELITELTPKILQKQLKINLIVAPGVPIISVDPQLVRQVYLNLLTNAIKYTPSGGNIGVNILQNGEEVWSAISDSGLGIPKYEQDKLFNKFFRASNTIKMAEGTGLGLYLAKAVVESSGGKLWFKSEEGVGSTFTFSLPVLGSVPKAGEVTLGS